MRDGSRGRARRVLGVTGRGRDGRCVRTVPPAYSLVLALVVVGPLLGPGYLLLRDAVTTPRSYPTDSALGLGDAAPRAVPQDWLLAMLTHVVDGGVVVKAILVCALWAAGCGAAALARRLLGVGLAPQLVAATVAVWNPYVAERLLQGHWSLLAGYAALPWTALAAQRIRESGVGHPRIRRRYTADKSASPVPSTPEPDDTSHRVGTAGVARPESRTGQTVFAWLTLGGVFAAAGLTPTGAVLAGCVAVLLVGRRNLLGTVALWCAASAPWLVAAALSGAGAEPSDPAGIAAFAARAEPGLGTLGSLAGLGGIWNAQAVPGSRTTLFALAGSVVLLAIVATGIRRVAISGEATTLHARRTLLMLAGAAIVLPALGATGWGVHFGEFLVARVPGTGLLRDTQKYVALAMPAFALCAAAGCRNRSKAPDADHGTTADTAGTTDHGPNPAELGSANSAAETGSADRPDHSTARHRPRESVAYADAGWRPSGPRPSDSATASGMTLTAVLFIALLIAVLPDLAWGVGGALRPVHYPAGWGRVAARMDGPGDVAVLPGGMFREFPYSGRVPVLDPAPRMLPRDVLQTGELPVAGGVVAGEGTRAHTVEGLLRHGAAPSGLAAEGVGWILVEHNTPGPVGDSKATLAQLNTVYSDHDLTLYRIPDPVDPHPASRAADRRIATGAHIVWALLLAAAAAAWITPPRRRPG